MSLETIATQDAEAMEPHKHWKAAPSVKLWLVHRKEMVSCPRGRA